MSLRLEDLDAFLAVAQQGRVRLAAQVLGLSQPATTKAIQRLEQELGFPLFTRSRQGMALTRVARRFHEQVAGLRQQLGQAIREAADSHLGERSLLRVGVSPLYAQRLFVPACLRLHAERPAARLSVQLNLNDALLRALRAGETELCLSALPAVMPPDLKAFVLMDDDLCIALREGHPLLGRRRPRLADLTQGAWMLPAAGVAARAAVEALLAEDGLAPPRVVVEVNNTAAQLLDLVRRSDLITLLPLSMLRSPAGAGVVPLPIAQARLARRVGLLMRAGQPLAPLAQRLAEILQGAQGDRR